VADDLSQVGRALALEMLGITASEVEAPEAPPAPVLSVDAPPQVAPTTPEPRPAIEATPEQAVASAEPGTPARSTGRRRLQNGVEWLGVVLIAILVALVIKLFVIQAFSIPSESMVDTLEVGDRVLVNKLSYDAHDIHRGDVVVFERPPAMASLPGDPDDLIKRVIALPGETIEAHDGSVFINGRQLIEPYLEKGTRTDNLDQPVVVPKGKIFVMGDNRTRSRDSRFIGTIDEDLVVGRAFARIWPLSRIGFL